MLSLFNLYKPLPNSMPGFIYSNPILNQILIF